MTMPSIWFATSSKASVTRSRWRRISRVTDAFEDVANQIDGIVIDHA